MSDDIVTRPEQEIDFVEYLRLWASPDGDDQAVRDLHKAADEIERLRAELNNAAAMANAYYELVQAYRWSHSHLGEWPDAIANLVAENYQLRKAGCGE